MMRVLGLVWALALVLAPAFAQEDDALPQDGGAVPALANEADATDTAATPVSAESDVSDDAGEIAADDYADEDGGGGDGEDAGPYGGEPFVVVCPIDGEINKGLAVVVKRAVEEAKNAEALIFVINTPGGRVDSAIDITTAIMEVECPTIAFIEGMGAISAGAIISYACDYIYMAEGTNIGASTPIMPGVETNEAMDEKSNSFVRGKYRALGEANGHDPLLGEAMVDRNLELRGYQNEDGSYTIFQVDPRLSRDGGRSGGDRSGGGRSDDLLDKILDALSEGGEGGDEEFREVLKKALGVEPAAGDDSAPDPVPAGGDDVYALLAGHTELISARGELLTMTSKEAVHFGLASGITRDVDETLREFALDRVNRMTITPTWEEALFALLTSPTIAGLLLMAGLGGLYVEVRTPGFGAPGIIGATCLALFFGSHMVLGMTSWIDVALIVAGLLLILAEVFLLPGFGLAGIMGFACLVGGAYMALVKAPIPEFFWDWQQFYSAMYTLTIAFISFIAFVVVSGLVLPYSPLARLLILEHSLTNDAGYTAQTEAQVNSAIGLSGVALSALRPAGKGRFGNAKYDVVTRGEFIDEGTPLRIIESSGNRYVVTALEDYSNV